LWTTLWSPTITNELAINWARSVIARDAEDPLSKTIPSIEINDLGMIGSGTQNRTAFGAAIILPQGKINDTYQLTDAISILNGNHSFKFGVELRRTDVKNFSFPSIRGSLVY